MNKLIYLLAICFIFTGFNNLRNPDLALSAGNIIDAEYYIDLDPGQENGIPLAPLDGTFDSPIEQVQLNLDTSSLNIGYHNLFIRMQNDDLLWGTPRRITFEVTGNKSISEVEYFINSPCEGTGISMVPVDGTFDQSKETALANVDTSDLSFGIHTIYVRMKDAEDHWGTCTAYKVEVREPPYITDAEYFIDEDPGLGNGALLPCQDKPCDSSVENLEADFRAWCLSVDGHTLNVRAKDSYGRWGATYSVLFNIGDAPIDVCVGDVTGNGVTNILDKVQVRNHFGESSDNGWWIDADLNCDGVVNILDKVIVRNDFGCSQE